MLRGTRPVARRALGALQRPSAGTSQLSFARAITNRSVRPGALRAIVGGQLTHKATYADKPPPLQVGRDAEDEKRLGEQKLKADPSAVSTESSVRQFYEPAEPPADGPKPEITDGLRHDLGIVKDTFSVAHVPKESYVLGLAGTLPYLATSLSTVFLSWNINAEPGTGFLHSLMLSQESAHWWLAVIEPIQLGYGAVIISFLGAIHWGLEYAEKKPSHDRTRFRYGLGVVAPMAAWPTMFLPVEFALTSQLAAFTGLYFADTTATKRGWAPSWYSSYRFVLTAIVGAAITISLIGRAKVGDAKPRLSGLSSKFHETHGEEQYSEKWAKLEDAEREKLRKKKEEEEKKRKEAEKKAKEEEKKNKKKEAKGKGDEKKQQQGKEGEKGEEQDSDDSSEEKDGEDTAEEKDDDSEKKDDKAEKKDSKAEKKDDKADKKDGKAEEKDAKKEAGDDQQEGGDDAAEDEDKGEEENEGNDQKKGEKGAKGESKDKAAKKEKK